MSYSDSIYLHAFNLLPEFGPIRLHKIGKMFPDFQTAFKANAKTLENHGIETEIAEKFIEFKKTLNLDSEWKKLNKENIWLLSYKDQNYPKLLLEISKPPPLLYIKGKMESNEELCVAVVGTRKISNYGRTVIPLLIDPLVKSGVTIVSGLAYGIDSVAHEIALSNNRRTIAILGGGLDEKNLYPKHHAFLAEKIIKTGGALISEYPMGVPNLRHHFALRNRIISGLSIATVVVECDLESGTLITAKHALDQNRTVYAVPGPIYSETSKGPNNLIKMGAKLISEANDILEDLNLKKFETVQETREFFGDTAEEKIILKIINREPINIDEIIKKSELNTAQTMSTLTFLEMKGKIRNLGGQQYILSR